MKSWKTTMFGGLAALGLSLTQVTPEGDLLHMIGQILAIVGTGGIGLSARDNDKTSEDVGAKE